MASRAITRLEMLPPRILGARSPAGNRMAIQHCLSCAHRFTSMSSIGTLISIHSSTGIRQYCAPATRNSLFRLHKDFQHAVVVISHDQRNARQRVDSVLAVPFGSYGAEV